MNEQLTLFDPAVYDHYKVELDRANADGEFDVLRTHSAKNVDSALTLIEGLRDSTAGRDGVTWQFQEVNASGILYGLAPGGVIWRIQVTPPLTVELSS